MKIVEVNSTGDFVEVGPNGEGITIAVYEPWAGDTETGFGRGGTVWLTKDQAKELGNHLLELSK